MAIRIAALTLVSAQGISGGKVVVSHEKGIFKTTHLFTVNEDGSDERQILDCGFGNGGGCVQPEWSPDGSSIVYVNIPSNGAPNLWLTDPDGKSQRQLTTHNDAMSLLPTWTSDSKRVAFFRNHPGSNQTDTMGDSRLYIIDTQTGEERLLFESDHPAYGNTMPTLSPDGSRVAFGSNRSGAFRLWVANIDGTEARELSLGGPTEIDLQGDGRITPISQKVPRWSPDGRYVAHWEGVEMIYMSPFTHIPDPQRDQLISDTFHVWVVDVDSGERRNAGKGDDPVWSPDGRVTRAYPDPSRGGVVVMVETAAGSGDWQELPIVPPKTLNFGRFSWAPAASATVI